MARLSTQLVSSSSLFTGSQNWSHLRYFSPGNLRSILRFLRLAILLKRCLAIYHDIGTLDRAAGCAHWLRRCRIYILVRATEFCSPELL